MDIPTKLARYRSFLAQDPHNSTLIRDVIELSLAAGQFEQAVLLAHELMAQPEPDVSLIYQAVNAALAAGEYSLALSWLAPLTNTIAPPLWVVYDQMLALFRQEKFDQALAVGESHWHLMESSAEAVVLMARILHFRGDMQRALQLVECALQRLGLDQVLLGIGALIALDLGRLQLAENYASQALELNSAQIEALLVRASLALERLDPREANEAIASVLVAAPTMGRALLLKGQMLMLQEQYAAACGVLEQAAAAMPSHVGTWHGLGWCRLLLNDAAGGHHAFESALALDRNFAESQGAVAITYALLGRIDDAREHKNRAMKLDKNSFSGRFSEALIARAEGNGDIADRMIQGILSSRAGRSLLPLGAIAQMFMANKQRAKP